MALLSSKWRPTGQEWGLTLEPVAGKKKLIKNHKSVLSGFYLSIEK